MHLIKRKITGGVLFLVIAVSHSLDTTEPFDVGFSDFEMAGSFGGIGLSEGEKEFGWEGVIGVGITDHLSASFSYALSSNEFLKGEGTDVFSLGLFYSILNSGPYKLDLLTGIASGGSMDLGTEVNYDTDLGGIQLTAIETFSNRVDPEHVIAENEIAFHTMLEPLIYCNIGQSMQLLAAFEITFHHSAYQDEDALEIGDCKAGYNLVLSDAVEILPELSLHFPWDGEDFSTGFAVQFIATLPGVK